MDLAAAEAVLIASSGSATSMILVQIIRYLPL